MQRQSDAGIRYSVTGTPPLRLYVGLDGSLRLPDISVAQARSKLGCGRLKGPGNCSMLKEAGTLSTLCEAVIVMAAFCI